MRWVLVACLLFAAGGCGGASGPKWTTRDVPGEYPTIQAAVDASQPGDLVRIAPGIYHEAVIVGPAKRDVVIRGVDRNRVILDGDRGQRETGFALHADGVAVENLTVRGFAGDGVNVVGRGTTPLQGWRVSYVTAYANGGSGIAARAARGGSIDHAWTAGQARAGMAVVDCSPCEAVITDSVGERNRIGYVSTNASDVQVVRSVFRDNRVGVVLAATGIEDRSTQRDVALVGNRISNNANRRAAGGGREFGFGVLVMGGREDAVARNLITGHAGAGVLLTASPRWPAVEIRVQGNVLRANAVDLALAARGPQVDSGGSCFAQNRFVRSYPANIEQVLPCQARVPVEVTLGSPVVPPRVDWRTMAAPPAQAGMPDARTAAPQPGRAVGPLVVAKIDVPGAKPSN